MAVELSNDILQSRGLGSGTSIIVDKEEVGEDR